MYGYTTQHEKGRIGADVLTQRSFFTSAVRASKGD